MKRGRKPQTEDQLQGVCVICQKNKQMPGPRSKLGYKKYIQFCSTCAKDKYGNFSRDYRHTKKPHCERCGFLAVDPCQLDVHHVDRNHKNNAVENLLTLCSNCHRLEHKEDYKKWSLLAQE